jgi:hypothetical protein
MDQIGARGPRAWIAWDDGRTWDEKHGTGSYGALIEGDEDGPPARTFDTHRLEDALAWARARTPWVMVRPSWDEDRYYWAGVGPPPEVNQPDDHSDGVILRLPPPPWPEG